MAGKYTPNVVTRFYRPPEICLTAQDYTIACDLWGIGCIFAEMFRRKPILMGTSDLDQFLRIMDLVGTPTEESFPGWYMYPGFAQLEGMRFKVNMLRRWFQDMDPLAVDLLERFLTLDPRQRISAPEALEHAYFSTEPLAAELDALPRFDSSHEYDNRPDRDRRDPLKRENALNIGAKHAERVQ